MITALIVFAWILFAHLLLVLVGFLYKPAEPTALFGLSFGPLRLEANGGDEVIVPWLIHPLLFRRPLIVARANHPMRKFAVTHIQYLSRFGFFYAWPACFYVWAQLRLQQTTPNPNAEHDPETPTLRVPGTERGVYTRTPGWRWDAGDAKYILTGGQFGLHFD